MSENSWGPERFKPPVWAILGTILGVVAWLVFILLYALDWSKSYSLFQNIVVTIVSLLIAALLIAAMWVIWFFSSGGPRRWWWNNEDHGAAQKSRASNDILRVGQRCGEVVSAVIILLILAFYVYHQVANTGFYTSKFGGWEMFALYGSIVSTLVPPLARATIGRTKKTNASLMSFQTFTTMCPK